MRPGGEDLAQDRGDPLRLFADLLFAEADRFEAKRTQPEVPGVIVSEGLATPVVSVAVGFDHYTPIAPKEVDEIRADSNVHLRGG
jgi:hypothetical protein